VVKEIEGPCKKHKKRFSSALKKVWETFTAEGRGDAN
jgi:hypothetical protein